MLLHDQFKDLYNFRKNSKRLFHRKCIEMLLLITELNPNNLMLSQKFK